MKKRFTILMAAFTLLAFLAIPIGMRAAEGDVHDMNISQSTLLNNNAAIPSINISAQSYPVSAVTINWRYNKAIENPVTIEVIVAGTSWGTQTITGNTTDDAIFEGESVTGAIEINFTNNTGSGTGHGTFYVNSVKLTEGASSGPAPTTHTVTYYSNVSGTEPIEEIYVEGATVTIADNTFSNPGYAFTEWNTDADGDGDSYAPGNEIEDIDTDIELYAQWEESSTVTYTYNFAGANNFYTDAALTTHPSTGSGNNVGTIYYGDGSTFVASGTSRYFSSASSGYFLLGKTGAQISLPTFDGYKIKQVIVHTSGSVSGNVKVSIVSGNNTASAAQQWAANSDFTYDIDADYQTSALSLNVTNNYNSQFTSIELVCEADVPSTDPYITASDVDITYDATSGSIAYTINNGVDGGTVTAATESDWLTLGQGTASPISFTCTANENTTARTATVTLTYTYNITETVSKDVIVTQAAAPEPVVLYTSIPDLFTGATSTEKSVLVNFNSWIVSGVSTNGKNVYVTDGTFGFIMYYNSDMSATYSAGDILEGEEVSCKLKLYNGSAELLNVNAEDLTITSGAAELTPADIEMSELTGMNTGALVHYDNLTCSVDNNNYYLSDGSTTLQVYHSIYAFGSTLVADHIYNITGVYQQYTSTSSDTREVLPRSAADIEEVVSATPSITVTPNTVDVPAAGATGTLDITYENIEATTEYYYYYYCDANGEALWDEYDWIDVEINNNTLNYTVNPNDGDARTIYLKVYNPNIPSLDAEVYAIVTFNQAAYEAPNVTWNLSIDETATATEDEMTWTSDYATMAVEKGTSSTNTNNYYPGTSGHNYTSTRFYTGSVLTIAPVAGYAITSVEFTATTTGYASALMNSTWTNATASAEGTTVTITPTSGSGAIQATIGATCGFTQVKVYYEQHQAETYDLTISLNENIPFIFVFDANDQTNPLIEDGAAGTVQVLEGTSILVSPDVAEGYVLETLTVNNENVISQLDESGAYTFTMPAEDVTISATAVEDVPPTPGEWVMVNINELTEDDVFVIVGVYDEDESSFAMPNNGTGAPSAVDVTMVDNTLSGDIDDNLKWNLSIGEDGYTFYPNGETETWLYCNNTNNGVRVGTNENNVFTMTSEGYLYNNATERYIGIYNSQDWRCYTSINNNIKDQTFAFYKRVDEGSLVTYTLDIEGYQDDNNNGGYYLIASPVSMIRPTFENGFLTDAYDLYYFDQAQENEWRNYKSKHFNIAACKGYLYASKENTTLTFTGVPYQGNGEIELSYTEGGDFAGWNLVGNPYDTDVFIDRDFYVMNPETGGEIIAGENNTIAQYQGFFVIAEEDGEILRIGDDNNGNPGSKIVLNVSNARNSVIDRALIRFGEGRTLPKFMFNPNSTKLYINQNGKDFAVVRSINENSTPVSFHAAENGNYTLSINAENVEMEYLHLIDNMTGADVDLLASPSYSFEARTTDIANRFRLVYATTTDVNGNNVEPFAFFNGSEWTINNTNNGMVQVIDQLGHVVLSENAAQRISTASMAAGVYTIRLVNNNEMKTQKIIVR